MFKRGQEGISAGVGRAGFAASSGSLPRHVALSVGNSQEYSLRRGLPLADVYQRKFENIKGIAELCTRLNIPITTFYLLPLNYSNNEIYSSLMDSFVEFFSEMPKWEFLRKNKVKVTVLGKWYDLPGRVVDAVKRVIDETKDYDSFFLNFCLNYDGQEEIVDACRILAKQVQLGRLSPGSIDKAAVKENLYTSYFLPPELIIKTGPNKRLSSLLLWDSPLAKIHFSGKFWAEFTREDFLSAVEWWQKT